ncbi:MAG: hypothetical protein AAB667_01165 [Patescibacteria group bacterium]
MDEEHNNSTPTQESLRELKSRYNRAKELLEKIDALHVKFESAQSKLDIEQGGIERISNDAKTRFDTIENTKNESATLLGEIKSNLEKTQTTIAQMEEGVLKLENLKGKLEGREGEINTLASTASGLIKDIESSKTSAQQRLVSIEDLFGQVQEKIAQMQSAYESFAITQAKISDGNTGLQAILNQSQDLQKKSSEVFTEIKSFRDEAKATLDKIQDNEKASDSLKSEIENHLKTATDKQEQVAKLSELLTAYAFSNKFGKRRKTLSGTAWVWFSLFISGIIALTLLLKYLFIDTQTIEGILKIPEFNVIAYRLTLTSPLLFLIAFAMRQYGNERSLEERYAFKEVVATVMPSHIDQIIAKEDDTELETRDFVRKTLTDLYVEPFEDKKVDKQNTGKDKDSISKDVIGSVIDIAKRLKEAGVSSDDALGKIVEVLLKK